MNFAKTFQTLAMADLREKRWLRILLCAAVIAIPWTTIDTITGNLTFNVWHDAICLLFGIVTERLIPWNKLLTVSNQHPNE